MKETGAPWIRQDPPLALPQGPQRLTSQCPQPNTWAEVSVVGGRSRSWGGGGGDGQTRAPDSACTRREGGPRRQGSPGPAQLAGPLSPGGPHPGLCMEQRPSALFPNSKEASWAAAQTFLLFVGCLLRRGCSLGLAAAGLLSHPGSLPPVLLLRPSVLGGLYSGHTDLPPVASPTSMHPYPLLPPCSSLLHPSPHSSQFS